jgi:dipeptidyl aminopeptidase/acylaminoacyl peptidase
MRRGFFVALQLLVILIVTGFFGLIWRQQQRLVAGLALADGHRVLMVGQEVGLVAVASNGRAVRIELWANDQPTDVASDAPFQGSVGWSLQLRWRPESPGPYRLFARLFTAEGHTVDSPLLAIDVVPEGTLAFASNRQGGNAVYQMQLDGQHLVKVAERGRAPAWGAAGTLYYVRDVAIWQQQGVQGLLLVPPEYRAGRPAWQQRLAFESQRGTLRQVLLRDPNGAIAALPGLTGVSEVFGPAWGPDGREVVVAARVGGNLDIYRVSLAQGGIERLTSDPADDWQPAWSLDGRQLLFTSDRAGVPQIFWRSLLDPQRGDQPVTAHLHGAAHASWSPDGEWFVYVVPGSAGAGTPGRELYLQRLADGYAVRLTENDADDTEPAWQPPPTAPGRLPHNSFLGEYFANLTLTGEPLVVRVSAQLDWDWGLVAPLEGLPADGFSARWQGRFAFPTDADYLFVVAADAGARLWLDETLLIDGWTAPLARPLSAPIRLSAGVHLVRVEYYDDQGPARLLVRWEQVP